LYNDPSQIKWAKEKLNKVSPSFCMAKWMHSTIHIHLGRTHSCYLNPTHAIPLEEIKEDVSALHNTKQKMKERQMMLEGERPQGCSACWDIEDLPGEHFSERHYRGQDCWTQPFYDKVTDQSWDTPINPTYLEVSFSGTCNFKCSYCSPSYSSTWQKEVEEFGGYTLSSGWSHHDPKWLKDRGEMPLKDKDNPYVEAFWNWWPKLKRDLMFFRITGGEPLLSPDTFKVLKKIKEQPLTKLELSINSNLGVPQELFEKFRANIKELIESKSIKRFMLHTSIDTYGPQAEYIRNGLNFTEFKENVEKYLESIPQGSLSFMSTFNALSLPNYLEFLHWVLKLRKRFQKDGRDIYLDIPHLKHPRFMALQMLPKAYRHYMGDIIYFMQENLEPKSGIKESELLKMKRIFSWMEEVDQWNDQKKQALEEERNDFRLFFREHDKRRGTSIEATFPEYSALINP
jgi:organic radical activating enzyme